MCALNKNWVWYVSGLTVGFKMCIIVEGWVSKVVCLLGKKVLYKLYKHLQGHTNTHSQCVYIDTCWYRGHSTFSVLSAKHMMHIISNNETPLTHKSLITCSTVFYELYPDPERCAESTFLFFQEHNIQPFYFDFNKAQQQIRFYYRN